MLSHLRLLSSASEILLSCCQDLLAEGVTLDQILDVLVFMQLGRLKGILPVHTLSYDTRRLEFRHRGACTDAPYRTGVYSMSIFGLLVLVRGIGDEFVEDRKLILLYSLGCSGRLLVL